MTTGEPTDISLPRLTRDEPEVDKKEPWGDDKLKRQLAANALANLVKTQRRPFVVSLDGDWGTGKTFFLQRWKQQLENDQMKVVYFNAWQDDFFGDPLIPMLAQIINTVPDANDLRRAISEPIGSLLYRNIQGVTDKVMGAKLPDLGDNILKAYRSHKDNIDRLRQALTKVSEWSQHPLVFIVDELDRCRPDFAVATLERTKHILDIPGLVFVYGLNRSELCKSIASIYGNINVNLYIKRFFDIEFSLPAADPRIYCSYMAEQYSMSKTTARLTNGAWFIQAVLDVLGTMPGLSLRDIEQCFRIATFATANMDRDATKPYCHAIVAVIVVWQTNHKLYQKFARGEHVAGQMIDCLVDRASSSGALPWLIETQPALYAVCDQNVSSAGATALGELAQLTQGNSIPKPARLAKATSTLNEQQLGNLVHSLRHLLSDVPTIEGRRVLDPRKWRMSVVSLLELAARA